MERSGDQDARRGELKWRVYERVVAAVEAQEEKRVAITPTPNARIVGCVSGIERQVDLLLDVRWGEDVSSRTIVDAKMHRAKLDIKDVEQFEGMMRDCRAPRGIIVAPNGFTEGAERRAQDAITLKILPMEEVDDFDWAAYHPCLGTCRDRANGEPRRGLVLWEGAPLSLPVDGAWWTMWPGKCDACHNFHVWCWACGGKFALSDEDEHRCECGWLWVSAIEEELEDRPGSTLNAVHLLVWTGEHLVAIDRRPLR